MRFSFSSLRVVATMICVVCFSLFNIHPLQTLARTPQLQKPSTRDVAAKPMQADGGWPRSYTTSTGANVVVYTPQVASWEDQKHMTLYSAVAYMPKDGTKRILGSVRVEATTTVALDDRLVQFSIVKITDSNFPTLSKEQVQEIVQQITSGIPQHERVIALDRVLASIDTSQIIPRTCTA